MTETQAPPSAPAPSRRFFAPKEVKEGRLLLKGVRKFIRYNSDRMDPERITEIEEKAVQFRERVEAPEVDAEELGKLANDLTRDCERSVPQYRNSGLKENIEVIFVAFVIAMGIRAYFVQPFKIPTGSMQPTLNGIIGYPHKDVSPAAGLDYDEPGALSRLWQKFWYGRSYVYLVADRDMSFLQWDSQRGWGDHGIYRSPAQERNRFKFFTRSYLRTRDGEEFSLPGSAEKVVAVLNSKVSAGQVVREGEVIARGYIDTGDQVLVDKFSYHWSRPKRGQVFVFTTNGITDIENSARFDPAGGSQHYIKRLAGVPGDKLVIEPPLLYVNGEVAEEPGFQRVMSRENGYHGYSYGRISEPTLGPKEYFALGDNSGHSFDSKEWGVVPEENIVGKALLVYWPFGTHAGLIR